MYTSLKKSTTAAFAVVGLSTLSNAAEWNLNNNGTWETNANPPWNTGSAPNGVDAVADFSKIDITNHRNIAINGPITVGSLILGDTNGNREYRFNTGGGGGALTFEVSSGNASLTKGVGAGDKIYVPVTLNSDLDVNISAGEVLFNNSAAIISGTGGINKTGAGRLRLGNGGTNPVHTYTGTLTISEGRVMTYPTNNLGPGNVNLNGGILTYYWGANMTRSLGSGLNQIQFSGGVGATGLSQNGNNGLTTTINNNTGFVVQWGSTFFNPDTLVLQGDQTQVNANHRWRNPIDLNGADRTIEVSTAVTGGNNRAEIEGVISNSGAPGAGLIKVGNSKLQLERVNTYDGNTTISEGTLSLTGSGSINNSPVIMVAAGATFDVSGKAGYTPAAGQKISGPGTVAGGVTFASGAILAPGSSPGTTNYTSDQTWAGGGVYEWEIQDWNGSAGDPTGWDFVDISDAGAVDPTLDITATSGDPFVIEITEFSLTNFAPSATLQVFEIATAEGGITGFDADDFTLDTTNWTGGGIWNIVQSGNSIQLTHIPEPSTTALLGLGGLALVFRRRK